MFGHNEARRRARHRNPKAIGIPEARIVFGKHSPNWSSQPWHNEVPNTGGAVTYARTTPMAESAMALIFGLWPLIAITVAGIALLWSGTVYGTP
jgi:hypothetical protein